MRLLLLSSSLEKQKPIWKGGVRERGEFQGGGGKGHVAFWVFFLLFSRQPFVGLGIRGFIGSERRGERRRKMERRRGLPWPWLEIQLREREGDRELSELPFLVSLLTPLQTLHNDKKLNSKEEDKDRHKQAHSHRFR